MTTPPIPLTIHATVDDLMAHGWSFAVEQATDGTNPFIRIQAHRADCPERIIATWHSREAGGQRYRWRYALRGDVGVPTLAKLRAIITGGTP